MEAPELIEVWQQAALAFCATATQVPDGNFAQPSSLPGWTVGDIVAHVAALESELAGDPLPDHHPDWAALPHANDPFSRYTETGVDARRGRSPGQLRAELDDAVSRRADLLRRGPQDGAAMVTGVGGIPRTLDRTLRMRIFDIYLHDLDVRDTLGWPRPAGTRAARVTLDLQTAALPYVWGKRVGAGAGRVLHVAITGDLDADLWVGVGKDGRGAFVAPVTPTVTLTADWMDYLRLSSGRGGTAGVDGDADLGRAALAGLNVSP